MCPVCGWPELNHFWLEGQPDGTRETCPSCAFEFGVGVGVGVDNDDDLHLTMWRFRWIAEDRPFRAQDGRAAPPNWDPEAQLDVMFEQYYPKPPGGPYTCPVCGFPDLDDPPYYESGGGSHQICDSCGFQFDYTDDDQGYSFELWRARWVAYGMSFRSADNSPIPEGWDPRAQLPALLDSS